MKSPNDKLILQCLNNEIEFDNLDKELKYKILVYIQKNELGLKFFKNKWFDILTRKFYVNEYKCDLEYECEYNDKISFDSFEEFFKYSKGDIYDNTCFYGYKFSDDEIKKYNINISKLNFTSFTEDNILKNKLQMDDFYKEIKNQQIIIANLQNFINECNTIKTTKLYIEKQDEFKNKFIQCFDNFFDNFTNRLFNSLILQKHKNLLKKLINKFTSEELLSTFNFGELLILNGIDGANAYIKALENAKKYKYDNNQKVILYKEILKQYKKGEFKTSTFKGFNKYRQLYFIQISYYFKNNNEIFYTNYYTSFDAFIKAANFDLGSANLLFAPTEKEKLKEYKFDKNTKFPFEKEKLKYIVFKEFKNDKFFIIEKYINEDNETIFSKTHEFECFFDFVSFLNGDLKNSNLLLCNGIENIKGLSDLNLDDIKVRSSVKKELGLKIIKSKNLEQYAESEAVLS